MTSSIVGETLVSALGCLSLSDAIWLARAGRELLRVQTIPDPDLADKIQILSKLENELVRIAVLERKQ